MRLYHKFALMAAACFISAPYLFAAIPAGYTGTPFSFDTLKGKPQQIPGIVKAVFFDNGGEGIAYHDNTTGNTGGTMRVNATNQQIAADINVDMQSYSGNDWDVVGYGTSGQHDSSVNAAVTTWHLSWIDASGPTTVGDWIKCTVHVNTAGTYYVSWKQATANPGGLQTLTFYDGASVKIDSISNIPVCIVPPGCPEVWHAWTYNKNIDSVALDTGLQVVKLAFITGSWNFDWMQFTLKSATPVFSRVKDGLAQKAFDVRPIITGTNLTVSYSLSQAGRTTVSVFDCAGRTAASAIASNLNAGNQKQIFGLGNMGPGVYFVRVEQNGFRETKSFTTTR
jgi:hypothetical protein